MKKNTKNDANTGSKDKPGNSVNDSDSNKMRKARRRLIQGLVAGGVVVTAKSVPGSWSRPVVDAVTLPAHARTSGLIRLGNNTSFFAMNTLETTESLLASGVDESWDAIMNTLIEEAVAVDGAELCGLTGCSYIEYQSGESSGKLFVTVADLPGDLSTEPTYLSFDFTHGVEGSLNDPCFQSAIPFRVDLMGDDLAKLTIWFGGKSPIEVDLVKVFNTCIQGPPMGEPTEDGFN